jgi:hypothetical protein
LLCFFVYFLFMVLPLRAFLSRSCMETLLTEVDGEGWGREEAFVMRLHALGGAGGGGLARAFFRASKSRLCGPEISNNDVALCEKAHHRFIQTDGS